MFTSSESNIGYELTVFSFTFWTSSCFFGKDILFMFWRRSVGVRGPGYWRKNGCFSSFLPGGCESHPNDCSKVFFLRKHVNFLSKLFSVLLLQLLITHFYHTISFLLYFSETTLFTNTRRVSEYFNFSLQPFGYQVSSL